MPIINEADLQILRHDSNIDMSSFYFKEHRKWNCDKKVSLEVILIIIITQNIFMRLKLHVFNKPELFSSVGFIIMDDRYYIWYNLDRWSGIGWLSHLGPLSLTWFNPAWISNYIH